MIYVVQLWVGFAFVEFGCLGFVDFVLRLLDTLVIMIVFHSSVYLLICLVLSISYPLSYVLLTYA